MPAFLILMAVLSCNPARQDFVPSLESQGIEMDGISNCRQLGGYPVGDRHIVADALIRSANLSGATDADLHKLHDRFHTTRVFDFRSSFEHNAVADRIIEDCRYIWLPCLEQISKNPPASAPKSGDPAQMAQALLGMLDNPQIRELAMNMYPLLVFDPDVQDNYATFLRELADLPQGESALWHCSQGKDRTGWGAAFLLACLGAERDLIVKDFELSNTAYAATVDAIVNKAKEEGRDEQAISVIYSLVGVNVKLFEQTLDSIEDRYGSLDEYLAKALGVDDSLKERLRARFLQ